MGMHFMNPVPVMKLVELIRGLQTEDAAYEATRALAVEMGKTVITSKDCPGFLVNRILIPLINEACFALQEGLGTAEDIEGDERAAARRARERRGGVRAAGRDDAELDLVGARHVGVLALAVRRERVVGDTRAATRDVATGEGAWTPVPITRDNLDVVVKAGAAYGNPEFVQVHPTAIPGADKLRLMSESARGEGGRVLQHGWPPAQLEQACRV